VHEAMQQRPVQTRSTWQGMSSFILAMPCNEPSLDYLTQLPLNRGKDFGNHGP
jgi:hypothetical protein